MSVQKWGISPRTVAASLCSRFAREIRNVLLHEGCNYAAGETRHPAAVRASATWERTDDSVSLRQVSEYTFGDRRPRIFWWRTPSYNPIQDPCRRFMPYPDKAAAELVFPGTGRIFHGH